MTTQQTLTALSMCHFDGHVHDCTGCPLVHEHSCHDKLRNSAIESIMHERGIIERYIHELDNLRNQLSNLYVK